MVELTEFPKDPMLDLRSSILLRKGTGGEGKVCFIGSGRIDAPGVMESQSTGLGFDSHLLLSLQPEQSHRLHKCLCHWY